MPAHHRTESVPRQLRYTLERAETDQVLLANVAYATREILAFIPSCLLETAESTPGYQDPRVVKGLGQVTIKITS